MQVKTELQHSHRPDPSSRTGAYVLTLAALLICLLLAELASRLMTETLPNGLKKFANVALLPLRPDATLVRRALDSLHGDLLLMRDPDIGWIVKPNRADNGDYTNAQGIRANPKRLYS